MIVACPHCSAVYDVPMHLIGPGGAAVRCPHCAGDFTLGSDGEVAPAVGTAGSLAEEAVAAPSRSDDRATAEESAPAARAPESAPATKAAHAPVAARAPEPRPNPARAPEPRPSAAHAPVAMPAKAARAAEPAPAARAARSPSPEPLLDHRPSGAQRASAAAHAPEPAPPAPARAPAQAQAPEAAIPPAAEAAEPFSDPRVIASRVLDQLIARKGPAMADANARGRLLSEFGTELVAAFDEFRKQSGGSGNPAPFREGLLERWGLDLSPSAKA